MNLPELLPFSPITANSIKCTFPLPTHRQVIPRSQRKSNNQFGAHHKFLPTQNAHHLSIPLQEANATTLEAGRLPASCSRRHNRTGDPDIVSPVVTDTPTVLSISVRGSLWATASPPRDPDPDALARRWVEYFVNI